MFPRPNFAIKKAAIPSTGIISGYPKARATHVAGHALTAGAFRKLLFDTLIYDTHSWFSLANDKFIPLQAGYYLVVISTGAASNIGNNCVCAVYKNGALDVAGTQNNSSTFALQTTALIYCDGIDDYIEAFLFLSTNATVFNDIQITYIP